VQDGGYAPTRWLLGAIFFLALLVVVVLSAGVGRLPRTVLGSIVLLAAFTAWSGLSIAWADVRGDAWDGANRTFLYFLVYVLFVTRPWRSTVAALVLGAFALGITLIGGIEFLRAVHAGTPLHFFIGGRLATPIAYPNATAALFLAASWPALFLASRREVPILVRGLMLSSTGVLVELALMAQSRGSLFAVPLVGALYFAVVPGRVRSVLVLIPVGLAAWASGETLLDIYTAVTTGKGVGAALVAARTDVLWSAAALFAVGIVIALLDRRVALPEHVVRVAGRVTGAIAAAGIAAAAIALVLAYGNPLARAGDGWRQFKENTNTPQTKTYLVSGLGSKRYDLWRVAALEFKRSPVAGIGADNFAVPFLRQRKTAEAPLYPHSLELRLLSQTGIIGTLLFAGFLAFALAGAWRSIRRGTDFARGLAGVATIAFAYWFTHGSVDWFWEMPVLGASAFAWLGIALRTVSEDDAGKADVSEASPRTHRWLGPAVAVLALPAAAAFAFPWIAARQVDAAVAGWRSNPEKAFDRLDLARGLNPLSEKPDLIAGVIAGRLGDRDRQRAAFEHVLLRNGKNWYAHLQLGILNSLAGRRAAAVADLRQAMQLNPKDPVVLEIARQVKEGHRVKPAQVERLFAERFDYLTGRRQT
jgi:O-antigen ligase